MELSRHSRLQDPTSNSTITTRRLDDKSISSFSYASPQFAQSTFASKWRSQFNEHDGQLTDKSNRQFRPSRLTTWLVYYYYFLFFVLLVLAFPLFFSRFHFSHQSFLSSIIIFNFPNCWSQSIFTEKMIIDRFSKILNEQWALNGCSFFIFFFFHCHLK